MRLEAQLEPSDDAKLLELVRRRLPNFNGKVFVQTLEGDLPYREENGVYSVNNYILDITYGFVFQDTLAWHVTAPDCLGHRNISMTDNRAIVQHGYMTYELFDDNQVSVRKWIAGEDVTIFVTRLGALTLHEYLRTWGWR